MTLDAEPSYDFDLLAPKERIIFFDIETTGLSAAKAAIYLIGAVYYEDGGWKLRQFFADSLADERELLQGFFGLINDRKKLGRLFLVSFNGDGFDLPFIKNCLRQYALDFDFTGTFSLDLFKKVRPYKKLAGLENCSLKTIEKELFGICREDKYTGGELIYVYEEYLRLAALDEGSCEYNDNNLRLKDALLKALLLHNAEDILDMPLIMDVLGYDSLFEGGFTVTESRLSAGGASGAGGVSGADGAGNASGEWIWDIHARLDTPLPKGIYAETPEYVISISEEDRHELNIVVTLYEGELRSFYADYKNYYYLPAEDMAVHKSVGEFVDKKARRQATARTCYQRVKGLFIPETEAVFAPMMYKEYKAAPAYGRVPEESLATGSIDREKTRRYVLSMLKSLKETKKDRTSG